MKLSKPINNHIEFCQGITMAMLNNKILGASMHGENRIYMQKHV